MTDIRGYVLAGGKSSRMGSDKALLNMEGRTAIERQCEILETFCAQGVFIAGARSSELSKFSWPVIQDSVLDQGPLFGIISALQHAENGIAVILAVDLLAISTADITAVLAASSQDVDSECDVFFAQSKQDPSEHGAQPLCAAWRVESSLAVLSQQLEQGQRSVMKAWLGLKRQGVLISESHLININLPSDFENFHRAKG
jgi:molybdopterin-guanine dinucleotide biosynthesis protein A